MIITRPKARPIEIHTADSMAASLMEITWAVLCTASRSMISIAEMAPIRPTQAHHGVSKLAKLSRPGADADPEAITRFVTSRCIVGDSTATC